jgi:hypothetical protein
MEEVCEASSLTGMTLCRQIPNSIEIVLFSLFKGRKITQNSKVKTQNENPRFKSKSYIPLKNLFC